MILLFIHDIQWAKRQVFPHHKDDRGGCVFAQWGHAFLNGIGGYQGGLVAFFTVGRWISFRL
jgi:hypothetical protein